jgi:hypothetical protein
MTKDTNTEKNWFGPSLSPWQEWRLHNGEGPVPDWFLRWSERVANEIGQREYERGVKDISGTFALWSHSQIWRKQGHDEALSEVESIVEGMRKNDPYVSVLPPGHHLSDEVRTLFTGYYRAAEDLLSRLQELKK